MFKNYFFLCTADPKIGKDPESKETKFISFYKHLHSLYPDQSVGEIFEFELRDSLIRATKTPLRSWRCPVQTESNVCCYTYGKRPKNSNTKASDKMRYANSVDPDQTAPEGAVWSGSTLFAIPLNI